VHECKIGRTITVLDVLYQAFLGLPMIQGFMRQSRGTVRVVSEPNVGSPWGGRHQGTCANILTYVSCGQKQPDRAT
jgi:hypothetical protein